MIKLILKSAVVLGLGLTLLAGAGLFAVPPAAKAAVERGSEAAFGVPSSLGRVAASPGLGTTTLGFSDYELSSPEGFEAPLLTFGRFEAGVGTRSLLGDVKELAVLRIEDVELNILQSGLRSNLAPVLTKVRELQGSASSGSAPDQGAPPADGDADDPSPTRVKIGRVRIAGLRARLVVDGIPGVAPVDEAIELPELDLDGEELCGEDGATLAELGGALLQRIEVRALDGLEGEVPKEVLDAVRKALEGGLEGALGGALEGVLQDAAGDLGGALEESAGGLLEGLNGVLGGK